MMKQNKKLWAEKFSKEWATFLPPERPSVEEVTIYEDYLLKVISKRGKKIKALLLGVTPELRDLLARYEVETVCVDINPAMVEAMNKLLEVSDGQEEIVITDWKKVLYADGEFDLIIGDHSMHWILFDDWDEFLKDKIRLMKSGGYFILNMVTEMKCHLITVDKMVEVYKQQNFFSREEKFYYMYLAIMGLEDKNYAHTKHLDAYNKRLEELKDGGVIDEREYDILCCPWHGGFSPTMPPKEVVDEMINKYFILKSIRYSTLNPSVSCHKIYFFQKNG